MFINHNQDTHLKHLRVNSISACFSDKLELRLSLINVKKYSSFPKQHNAFNHFDFNIISLDSKNNKEIANI